MVNLDQIEIIEIINEHQSVQFTGKIEIVDKLENAFLGLIILNDGQPIFCQYHGAYGLKAFFRLLIDQIQLKPIKFKSELQAIDANEKNISHNYANLKKKALDVITQFEAHIHQRPPAHLNVYIRADFIGEGAELNESEYDLLCTISDFNSVSDIYSKSSLIDYEVTQNLISLRKKGALVLKEIESE